jgi:hypothetical protein
MNDLKEMFDQEANKLAEGLVEGGSQVASEGSLAEKEKPEKKKRQPREAKDKPNSCGVIVEKLEGVFWRCAISGRIYYTSDNSELTEAQANRVAFNMKKDFGANYEDFWVYLRSDEIEERNPLKEYFEALKPQPQDFMEAYFNTLVLAEPKQHPMLLSIFRKWLIGAVAMIDKRQFFPNLLCPVLISKINTGKTSFFDYLTFGTELDRYAILHRFSGGTIIDKDTESKFAGSLLIKIDDLNKNDFRQQSAFRTLISAKKFDHRPPYGKIFTEKVRIASLCGTANYTDIVNEANNNRRIIPVEIEKIDFEALNKIAAGNVWASAWEHYKEGELWTLTPEEVAFVQRLSGDYTDTGGLGDFVLEKIKPCDSGDQNAKFGNATFLRDLVLENNNEGKMYSSDAFGKILKSCGFTYGSKRLNGSPTKGYYYKDAV